MNQRAQGTTHDALPDGTTGAQLARYFLQKFKNQQKAAEYAEKEFERLKGKDPGAWTYESAARILRSMTVSGRDSDNNSDSITWGDRRTPTRAELEVALEDADREGAPMDMIELAAEFGITREEAEQILEGGI